MIERFDYNSYLIESRKHLENATRNLSALPACCISNINQGIDNLWNNQIAYENEIKKEQCVKIRHYCSFLSLGLNLVPKDSLNVFQ